MFALTRILSLAEADPSESRNTDIEMTWAVVSGCACIPVHLPWQMLAAMLSGSGRNRSAAKPAGSAPVANRVI
jgi:hypothetical protein